MCLRDISVFIYLYIIYIYVQAWTHVPFPFLLNPKTLLESFSQIRQTPYFAGKTITAVRSDGRSVCHELFIEANYKLADFWHKCAGDPSYLWLICSSQVPEAPEERDKWVQTGSLHMRWVRWGLSSSPWKLFKVQHDPKSDPQSTKVVWFKLPFQPLRIWWGQLLCETAMLLLQESIAICPAVRHRWCPRKGIKWW